MSEHSIHSYIGDSTTVRVNFNYTGPEHAIMYPNDKARPFSPAEIVINSVTINGDDISENLHAYTLDRLYQTCWDYIIRSKE
jgi:hypothetical protein